MADSATQEAQRDDLTLTTQELLARYAAGPTLLEIALRGLGREQMHAHPIEGKWSPQEALCHICDAEQFFADRIKRTLAMHRPLLMGVDQSDYHEQLRYGDRVPTEELALVELTRSQVYRILAGVPEDAWLRTGVHSETGLLTVRQLVLHAVRHLEHHLEAIREKRKALGLER